MLFLAIPDVLAAAVVAAFLLATLVMALIASHVIPDVPVIGGAIRNAVVGAIKAVASVLEGVLDHLVAPLALLVMGTYTILIFSVYFVVAMAERGIAEGKHALAWAEGAYTTAVHFTEQEISAVERWAGAGIAKVAARVEVTYTTAVHFTEQQISATVTWAAGAIKTVAARVEVTYATAVHFTEKEISATVRYAEGLYAKAVSRAETLFNQAEADLSTQVAALDAQIANTATGLAAGAAAAATTAAGAALHDLDVAAHDLVIGPWDALLDDLTTVVGALPAEIAQALGLPATLPRDLPLDLAGILGLVVPAVGAITAETARCSVPMCRNLGGLSSLFGELTDAALLGALLAFLAEAAADPAGAVTDAEQIAGPVVAAAAGGLRDLLGV